MIVVNVIGGLGNQMFQYAFAYSVSRKLNQSFELDVSDFETYWHPHNSSNYWHPYQLNVFQIKHESTPHKVKLKERSLLNRAAIKLKTIKHKLLIKDYYQEPYYHFDKNVFNIQGDTYFTGFWQSERYFKEYRDELLVQFDLKKPLCAKSKKYKEAILSNNSICLHIRRGDYVTDSNTNAFHGVCPLEYYQKATKYITQNISESCFYIFSDDLNWAKGNLDFIENKIFIESEEGIPNYEEMHLMTLCKHNIIANSSFSWWGAWLNQNPDKKVIAPKQWFADSSINTKDLIPKTWISL